MKARTQDSIIFILINALILPLVNPELNRNYSKVTTDDLVNPQLQESSILKQFKEDPAHYITKWNQTLVNDPEMSSMMFSVIGLADVVWGIVEVVLENNNTTALESFNSYQIFITLI